MSDEKQARFRQAYLEIFKSTLDATTSATTPYQKAVDYLNEQYDKFNITNEARLKNISSILANITVSFTAQAMAQAMELAYRELTFDEEMKGLKEQTKNAQLKNEELERGMNDRLTGLKKQNDLIDAQIQKLKDETELAKSQKQAIDKQVKDNRVIKATSTLGGFISENQVGRMIVPADMTRIFFDMIFGLVKEDLPDLTKPSKFEMEERK